MTETFRDMSASGTAEVALKAIVEGAPDFRQRLFGTADALVTQALEGGFSGLTVELLLDFTLQTGTELVKAMKDKTPEGKARLVAYATHLSAVLLREHLMEAGLRHMVVEATDPRNGCIVLRVLGSFSDEVSAFSDFRLEGAFKG